MRMIFFTTIAIAMNLLATTPAEAQFGTAGAIEVSGLYTPGVDMPLWSVSNYANRDYNAPSTFRDGTVRTMIPMIHMEGVFDSQNPQLYPEVNFVLLSAVGNADQAVTFPFQQSNVAPGFTSVRPTRNFGREVYADAGIVWDVAPYANVQANTQYEYYIFVSWPAGVGQAFGTPYNSGSTVLKVTYTITP